MSRLMLFTFVFAALCWSQQQPPATGNVGRCSAITEGFSGYLQGFRPLIAACVAVGVAITQNAVQRQSQKQNLFESASKSTKQREFSASLHETRKA